MGIITDDLIGSARRAYMIGIGGAGMSALARVLKHRGLEVSGSDAKETDTTRELAHSGIPVFIGQERAAFGDADLIIYSSAIHRDHLELRAARDASKKIYHRAEILSSLLNHAPTSVAILGTHGKTTTSSMISFVLSELGKNPTCLVGGDVLNLGTNTVLGGSELWVSEVDESDKSHEFYAPNYAVITNLEEDHLDHYKDLDELKSSFRKFLSQPRDPGLVIYSGDDPVLRELVPESGRPSLAYGLSSLADYVAENIRESAYGSEFDLMEHGFFVMPIKLSIPGMHNISNALGAIALLGLLGMDPETLAPALARFRGARRRLEVKWSSAELMVIDDYAHHPTEVRASIRALRSTGKHVTVIFQPHRYSRTLHFYKQFGRAFEGADELILTDIYSAGESNTSQISVDWIYRQVIESGHKHARIIPKKEILSDLLARPHLQGVVAFLGAGDIGDLADEFANRLKSFAAA